MHTYIHTYMPDGARMLSLNRSHLDFVRIKRILYVYIYSLWIDHI